MAYGLLIKNGSSRVQIDSENAYPTLYQSSTATVASGTAIASSVYQNLFFVRPATTVTNSSLYRTSGTIESSSATNIEYRILQETTSGLTVPATGYGFNIYNATGGCIFSATSSSYSVGMDLLAIGTYGFTGLYIDIPMPSSTYALNTGKIYVLMNTANFKPGLGYGARVYYEYLFDVGSFGTIRVWSYGRVIYGEPGSFQASDEPTSNGNTYVIAYLRG